MNILPFGTYVVCASKSILDPSIYDVISSLDLKIGLNKAFVNSKELIFLYFKPSISHGYFNNNFGGGVLVEGDGIFVLPLEMCVDKLTEESISNNASFYLIFGEDVGFSSDFNMIKIGGLELDISEVDIDAYDLVTENIDYYEIMKVDRCRRNRIGLIATYFLTILSIGIIYIVLNKFGFIDLLYMDLTA